ncbi:unnamed protein product [Lepeophtheirus salmonis]|uniref:(salmon louse) hypothetical protein n=1 Tax=Lepeophtheirus salmonis TaxID=72036 RepID=A0A7R8HFG4_LEPSM|nr:unnamed protein product [Lepeophtheirus salmonis]CAF3044091.1 unnamed protein product [Lepeophtheirus salmonis]
MAKVRRTTQLICHLTHLVGTGRELLVSDLPTLRDILSCGEAGCNVYAFQAYIKYSCTRVKKVPLNDLIHIKGQREKNGSKGPHQIGNPDRLEHNRIMRTLERRKNEKTVETRRVEKATKVRDKGMEKGNIEFFHNNACNSEASSNLSRKYYAIPNVSPR